LKFELLTIIMYPKNIQNIIDHIARFPTIGPKTAERIVLYLLTMPADELEDFSQAISNIIGKIKKCSQCSNYSENDPCGICSNPKRDAGIICVVAKPQDIQALEKTNNFIGHYHILGGTVNPIEGIRLEQLNFQKLIDRIKNNKAREIILAMNPDIEGETTILSINKALESYHLKITRLARGLPMGSDIEYADEVTLSNALKGRKDI